MISTAEQLLRALWTSGVAQNEMFQDIGHMGLIGDMYEGLTKEIMKAALFEPFDLQVRSGKIRGSNGRYSPQIDCMLVIGDGMQIPYTPSEHVYDITQVVAVLEVKKTLNKERLRDALGTLAEVAELALDEIMFRERAQITPVLLRMHADSFRAVCRRPFPSDGNTDLLTRIQQDVFTCLGMDAASPVRIVWAYGGYATEVGLRDAFTSSIQDLKKDPASGLPNLVICGDLSIVKSNGMPFVTYDGVGSSWDMCYSQPRLAIRNFLNIIWYRLAKIYKKDFLWLTDGKLYEYNKLLSLIVEPDGRRSFSVWQADRDKDLNQALEVDPEPKVISLEECVLIQAAYERGEIDISNQAAFLSELGHLCDDALKVVAKFAFPRIVRRISWSTYDELLAQLTQSGLLARERQTLRLTTSRCLTMITPKGAFAGENRDGRLMRHFSTGGLFVPNSNSASQVFMVISHKSQEQPAFHEGASTDILVGPPTPLASTATLMRSPRAKRLQELADIWRQVSLRENQQAPEIAVSIVQGDRFDAKARLIDPNSYLVEIAESVDLLLKDLVYRCLAHPTIFPEIGNQAAEVPCVRLSQFHTSVAALAQEVQPYVFVVPQCPERKKYAEKLYEIASNFVFFHSIAHVMLGHLRLLSAQHANAELDEQNYTFGSLPDAANRRSLEWAADVTAVEYLMRSCLALHEDGRPYYSDLAELVTMLERALSIVTMLPEQAWYPYFDPAQSHSLPQWRLNACVDALDKCLRRCLSTGKSFHNPPTTISITDMIAIRQAVTWPIIDLKEVANAFRDPRMIEPLQVWRDRVRPMLDPHTYVTYLPTT